MKPATSLSGTGCLLYQAGLLHCIVAFELTITESQGQQKLSQNKTAGEQQRIRESLAGSPDQNAREMATYMAKLTRDALQ